MNDITDYLVIYKSKDLESLNYCELKEFRKFALWNNEQDLAEIEDEYPNKELMKIYIH